MRKKNTNGIIKFRAWDKINRRMILADEIMSLELNEAKSILYYWYAERIDEDEWGQVQDRILIDDIDIMYSTNCSDKNGKEIHIGDIVKYKTFYYGEEKEHIVEVIKLWNGCIATINGNSFCPDWN
jgi:uncharacterized phage protein (TIGR01671 family)